MGLPSRICQDRPNPAFRASTIACARFSTFSLAKMRVMWLRTVFSPAVPSRAAICGVVAPARDELEQVALARRELAELTRAPPSRTALGPRKVRRAPAVNAAPRGLRRQQQVVGARRAARNCASGICGSRCRRPSSNGTRGVAALRCRIEGRARTRLGGRRHRRRCGQHALRKRAAFAGEVEMRWSSLNQRCCSRLPHRE